MSGTYFGNHLPTRSPVACLMCCTQTWRVWRWSGWTNGRSSTSSLTPVSLRTAAYNPATFITIGFRGVFFAEAEKYRDEQQIRTRLELRDRLKCKGFKWYLDNVWPEHFMPTDKRFFGKVIFFDFVTSKYVTYNTIIIICPV